MALDGFFFNRLVAEIKESIVGSRLEDTGDNENSNLILRFRAPGRTLRLEISTHSLPHCFFLSSQERGKRQGGGFAQTLKKHIGGLFCVDFSNPAFDRRATLVLATTPQGQGDYYLHIELMGRQNDVILCEGDIILASTRPPSRDGRTLQPHDRYSPPPASGKLSPINLPPQMLETIFSNLGPAPLDKALVQTIFGISPLLAKEICHRLGYWDMARDLSSSQVNLLCKEILALVDTPSQPVLYEKSPGPYWIPLTHMPDPYKPQESLSIALESWSNRAPGSTNLDSLKTQLQTILGTQHKKLKRTLKKQRAELNRAQNFDLHRQIADTLYASLHTISKGDNKVVLNNVYTGEAMEILLNPEKSPSQNAGDYYKKYNKYKNASSKIKEQMQLNQEQIEYLFSLEYAIESAQSVEDLKDIQQEMVDQGLIKRQRSKQQKKVTRDFLSFTSPGGETVLVGKNNRQNEFLTLRKAEKDHFWLHTRQGPGSHVILCTSRPTDSCLDFAASLAAWFSKEKSSPKVEVVWTQVKNVKKIPGAKPGMVQYVNYRSTFVEPRQPKGHG